MSDKVQVGPMDTSKKNSPVLAALDDEATVALNGATSVCYWNGQEFAEGELVSCGGREFECSLGNWIKRE